MGYMMYYGAPCAVRRAACLRADKVWAIVLGPEVVSQCAAVSTVCHAGTMLPPLFVVEKPELRASYGLR